MNKKLYIILSSLFLGILSSVFIKLPVLAVDLNVTVISPNSGPATGGTLVTISGIGFVDEVVASVTIGGISIGFSVTNDTTLTATTPANSAGPADITVTTSSDSVTLSNGFTYYAVPVPTVTTITPNSGPTTGNTTVTISGTGFYGGGSSSAVSSVTVGGSPAAGVSVISDSSLTVTTPSGSAGTVDVVVTTSGGSGTLSGGYTYYVPPVPTVTSIVPNSGPTTGNTTVTVSGTGFYGGGSSSAVSSVNVGGSPAAGVSVTSDTSLTATTPTGSPGSVDVVVTTSGGSGTLSGGYTYYVPPVPTVTTITPTSGPTTGFTPVAINGTGFYGGGSSSAVSSVTIGGVAATSVSVTSDTSLTATTPTGSAGSVDVVVTTSGGSATLTNGYTYVAAPTVTGISPGSGSASGGTTVTITGTNFTGATAVHFGSTSATSLTVNSATQITAASPAGSGTVDVTVTTPGGTSATSSADRFTYTAAPIVTSIAPNGGPLAGGTTVTITGTNFTGATAVYFGITSATPTVNSDTQITVTSPAGSGTVDVTVITPGGTSATSSADRFTYAPAPTVISVAPSGGPLAGGTSITITGTGFVNGASVTIGGTTTASSFVSATSLTATTPAGTAGAKSVVVNNPDTQTSNTNIAFTYAAAPTVTSITPNAGITAGGTTVTIIGTGFYGGGSTSAVSAVKFGSSNAASYTVNSDTRISAVTPPDTAHIVNIVITTSGGDGTLNYGYTYADAPTSTTTTTTTTPTTTASTTTTTPVVTTTASTTTTQTTTTSASAITTTPSTSVTTSTRPITSTTPVVTTRPAAFAPSSLIIDPGKVKPGEKVNISIKITNNGDITGTDEVSLKVNNLIVESKDVTLAGGESAVVTFTTNSTSIGKYTIALAGLNGNFTVSNSTTPGWLWPSAIGAFSLGIILAVGFGLLRNAKT